VLQDFYVIKNRKLAAPKAVHAIFRAVGQSLEVCVTGAERTDN